MPRSRIRLLLIIAVAAGLGDLALIGRSRTKPSVSPREAEQRRTTEASGRTTNSAGLQRLLPHQREQETTIRPRTANAGQATAPVPQPRSVEALSREELIELVEEAIQKTSRRYLDVAEYTPWQIMHGVLALRGDYKLRSNGQLVNGIDFISSGPTFRGDYWWEKTAAGGRGHPYSVPYHFEGHINQFPALLCMSALPLDHKLAAKGGTITVGDMVRNAQRTVNTNEEITWTLWFLTQYVNQNAEWTNQNGQNWSMGELVRLQAAADINNAPCGGTHALFALAFARNAYLRQNGQLRGPWVNAEYRVRTHIELARNLQNADGSFSINWFKGRGYTNDFKERIKTSGHMLEWLMMALPSSRLDEPWVRRGIQSVANDLLRNASAPAECGPMYHALHALVLYKERVVPKDNTPEPAESLAAAQPQTKPAKPAATPAPATPRPQSAATTPPQTIASHGKSAPTDANLLPPTPAPPAIRPTTPNKTDGKSTAQADGPKTHSAAAAPPGIVYLSPAAPATIAGNPAAGSPFQAAPVVPAPRVAQAPDTTNTTTPGRLTPKAARPLVISSEPLVGDAPMPEPEQSTQQPLLVRQPTKPGSTAQQPAKPKVTAEQPVKPDTTVTQSTKPQAAPPPPVLPQQVPVEIASNPPADLPPAIVAVAPTPPVDLPPSETTAQPVPVAAMTPDAAEAPRAEATRVEAADPADRPILPPVSLDAPVPLPPPAVMQLTIEPIEGPSLGKRATKPGIEQVPSTPVKVAADPDAKPEETRE